MSHTVSSCKDVFLCDERPTAELATIVKKSSDPGPLVLVSRPTIHHSEGVLTIIVYPLLLLGYCSISIVPDRVILAYPAPGRVITRATTLNSFSLLCNYRCCLRWSFWY